MTALCAALLVAVLCGLAAEIIYDPGQRGLSSPASPRPVSDLLAGADIGRGEKLARTCMACHTFGKDEPAHEDGPNLWNIVGSPKAARNYEYSDALSALRGTDWTYEDLNFYLYDTALIVPGGSMVYPGIKKAADRAALIAWMRSLSDEPELLPVAEKNTEDE
jgi:cytochrome c